MTLNPHKSSTRSFKTQGADEVLSEAALLRLCFGSTVGLWGDRLSSNCKASLSSSKPCREPSRGMHSHRLSWLGLEKG